MKRRRAPCSCYVLEADIHLGGICNICGREWLERSKPLLERYNVEPDPTILRELEGGE